MKSFSAFAPAKINLFLAITGRRADGFHDLVSVVAKLDFGDTLGIEPAPAGAAGTFSLTCDDPDVPGDETNLVLKAARAFASAIASRHPSQELGARFTLQKRIPTGAGLGGGSSDAAATLRALNRFAGPVGLAETELTAIATAVGSDCALFLQPGPVVMRGRGERISPLSAAAAQRLRGRRVLVFKPGFGIPTPWAYARLAAAAPASYTPAAEAERRLSRWIDSDAPAEELLFNSMEPPAFAKFLALPAMLDQVRRCGVAARMSGSGSACFALLPEGVDTAGIVATVRAGWGESAFVIEGRIA